MTDWFDRRDVLTAIGGSVAAAGVTGLANAEPDDTVEVNVGYETADGREAVVAAASTVVHDFSFDAMTVQVPAKAVDSLDDHSGIRYVEANEQMTLLTATGATSSGTAASSSLPWGVERIGSEVVHDRGYTGAGVDVAVLDSGIDPTQPQLRDRIGESHSVEGVRCFENTVFTCQATWDDSAIIDGERVGHGTPVAGIVGAAFGGDVVGVAPEVTFHAVQVSPTFFVETSKIALGLDWIAQRDYDLVNASLGGQESQMLQDGIDAVRDTGAMIVAGAGNRGMADSVETIAADPKTLAVSATTRDDDLWDGSSYGPEVDLTAPGKGVPSTKPGGGTIRKTGTSFSTPHVTGAAAVLLGQGYEPAEVRRRLLATAEDVGLSEEEQGEGLVDVAAASGPYVDRFDANHQGYLNGTVVDVDWTVSDPAGNLDSVTVELEQNGTVVDSGTLSVSGETDTTTSNDTTTVLIDSDGPSPDPHEVRLTVETSDGRSRTVRTTQPSTDQFPTIDEFTVVEIDPYDTSSFVFDWAVSDPQESLRTVDLALFRDGAVVDSQTIRSSGGAETSTGKETESVLREENVGDDASHLARLAVTTHDGRRTVVTTTEPTRDSHPTIDTFSVERTASGDELQFDVDWAVTDPRSVLDRVQFRLLDDETRHDERIVEMESAQSSTADGETTLRVPASAVDSAVEVYLSVYTEGQRTTTDFTQVRTGQ